MKQWKLVLVALLAVLLVCACTSALAVEETTAPAHHCSSADVRVEPTCGVDGSLTRWLCQDEDCPLGRYGKQVQILDATGNHVSLSVQTVKAATCTEAGEAKVVCTDCGKTVETRTVAALGHGELTASIPTPATCTKDGVKNVICTVCKEIVETKVLAATDHDFQSNKTMKEATCEAEGTVRYVCANGCGAWEDRATKALGHEKVVNEYVKAACGVEGATIWGCTNGCGQTWTEVTAAALTHKFDQLHDHKDPTCTVAGHNIYACTNNCGNLSEKEVIPAIGHKFTVKIGEAAVTCTTDGYVEYACANNCGEAEKQNIKKAPGHNYADLVTSKDSTCKEAGYQVWGCTECASEDIKALPKADHVPESHWVVTVPATCTLDGVETLWCAGCGIVLDERGVTAPGHTADKVKVDTAATCLEDGYGYIYCKKCAALIEAVVIPAPGHDLEDKIIKEATCVLDGLKDIECAVCDYAELNVLIKAEGHKGEWKVTTPATPEAEGEAKKICSVCGNELDRKVVPYTVMRYSNTATAFGPTTRELIGGKEWARVTPIDLSVEGTFTYPLVASNQYVIGTVTVTVANGSFVVNYDVAAAQIKVTAESLLVYADKAALAAGTAQAYAFGAPIAIGEDAKVMISVVLTVDYDAIGAGVTGFAADEAQIEAMKAIID